MKLSDTGIWKGEDLDFGPLPTFVGYLVRKAYSRLFQTFTEMFKDVGLAPGQYSLLMLIGLNQGLSQTALADATGIDRSTVVPITNRFVKAGWVHRSRRKEDRRVYSLRLTPQGQAILERAKQLIQKHEERFVANLNTAEKATLARLLAKLSETDAASPRRSAARSNRPRRGRIARAARGRKQRGSRSTAGIPRSADI